MESQSNKCLHRSWPVVNLPVGLDFPTQMLFSGPYEERETHVRHGQRTLEPAWVLTCWVRAAAGRMYDGWWLGACKKLAAMLPEWMVVERMVVLP